SSFIPLRRAGRNFKAVCPFHHEKTASFMVNPAKQIYHCFGCGVGGNAYSFLMRYERMEFPEAVEQLAKRAGVALPKSEHDSKAESLNTLLYKINELAAIYYQGLFNSDEGLPAKNYLLGRGIKKETIDAFKLGFAGARWDGLINFLRAKNINLSLLEKSGLIVPKQGGGYYDRFRNRIIFPIYDLRNRIIAFGGRILPPVEQGKDLAKYVNSPETPIYIKGKNLFGLNMAKDEIGKIDYAVIVEGYLDFLVPFQEGLHNVIASQGTALTYEQVRLLKRYTRNAVVVFDGDAAGETATLRSLDIFLEEEMEVKVVDLPQGFDPDTFIRRYGIKEFKERIEGAKTLFDYKLGALKSHFSVSSVEKRVKIANEMLPTIAKIKNAMLKSEYLKCLAEDLGLKEESLLIQIKKVKPESGTLEVRNPVKNKVFQINPAEKLLLKLMLEESELIVNLKGNLEPADFQDERAAKIVSIAFDLISQGKKVEPNHLISHLSDDNISGFIGELMVSSEPLIESERRQEIAEDCVKRLKNQRLRLKRERLFEEIKSAQDSKDDQLLQRLTQDFQQLTRGGF
ncbi:MAG: DNA primase, partial [Candidatus Omnitrophica bacterium]|nr:DNA primase [Candidatus Omnitrophota bacterium]